MAVTLGVAQDSGQVEQVPPARMCPRNDPALGREWTASYFETASLLACARKVGPAWTPLGKTKTARNGGKFQIHALIMYLTFMDKVPTAKSREIDLLKFFQAAAITAIFLAIIWTFEYFGWENYIANYVEDGIQDWTQSGLTAHIQKLQRAPETPEIKQKIADLQQKLAQKMYDANAKRCADLRDKKVADLTVKDAEDLKECGITIPFRLP